MAVTAAQLSQLDTVSNAAKNLGGPIMFQTQPSGQINYQPQFTGDNGQVLSSRPADSPPIQNNNNNNNGGGNNNSGRDPHINPATGNWDDNYYASQHQNQGPSQDEINAQIDSLYSSSNQYLDQAQKQLQSDFPGIQSDINNQYTDSSNTLNTNYQGNTAQLGQAQSKADYNDQNALAASRRLYSELNQGYQQRFGGASSAGQAAGELANVEQQRQQGQTQRSYQDTTNQINLQKTQIDKQFQDSSTALVNQKNAALNQATQDFQQKLLSITQNRAQNDAAKAQAKLGALQDLRNQVFAINQQNTQFQQTLAAQQNQANLQLQNYLALANNGVSVGMGAGNAFGQYANTQPTSRYVVGGSGQAQSGAPLTGSTTSSGHYDYTTGRWVQGQS